MDNSAPSSHTASTLFIGRWTVRVLYLLSEGALRHGELRRQLRPISQRMLTRTLRNLEATGLISRRVTAARSTTVQYSLTDVGKTFLVPLRCVCRWNERYGIGLSATIRL
ncbi:MAG TPA: helix-turn-helix domain-containing protein [Steroidobacteraceae bacterium]|nr:helix-turn-helix domain-containing protein [Steroidobacteraceae bacterium]